MADAETMRVALWHEALSRAGPGLLLRDLQKGDAFARTMAAAIRDTAPDILVLTEIDFDAEGRALSVFAEMTGGYPYQMPLRPNTGVPTGMDLNGDGTTNGAEDGQAFGRFPGQGGSAVLSRFPIETDAATSFGDMLWADLPGTHMTGADAGRDAQRLSSGGHWVVPVSLPKGGVVSLLVGHSTPPVFDGPDDRNGRRNLDELRLWRQISGTMAGPMIFAANTNLDPDRGDGYREAMAAFLAEAGFADPVPGQPTAHWERPFPMRVSYLLPSSDLGVIAAQVWPVLPDHRHSLITIDIRLPDPALP